MARDPWQELLTAVQQSGPVVRRRRRRRGRRPAPFDAGALAELRARFGLSQERFARMLGISVGTLRGWEQRRRIPDGPARMLLEVAARYPREVLATASGVRHARRAGAGRYPPPQPPLPRHPCIPDPPAEEPPPRTVLRPRPRPARNRGRAPA